jgi:hypothetical protein
VQINCDTGTAFRFLGDVESLPLWTGFYRRRLGREGDSVRFETPIGESLTHIEAKELADGGCATIVSNFAARTERAVVLVHQAEEASEVTFVVTFPEHVPSENRRKMLGQIEAELAGLKRRLETKPARRSILQAVP